MPRLSEAATFDRTIAQLIARREAHANGLAAIDALFAKYGITLNGARTPHPTDSTESPARKAQGRKRGHFDQTAEEFVLALLKENKGMTTAEVNAAWKKSGRGGAADNALGKLVKEKTLKRTPVKDGRGSTYGVA